MSSEYDEGIIIWGGPRYWEIATREEIKAHPLVPHLYLAARISRELISNTKISPWVIDELDGCGAFHRLARRWIVKAEPSLA